MPKMMSLMKSLKDLRLSVRLRLILEIWMFK